MTRLRKHDLEADNKPRGRLVGYARVSTEDQNLDLQCDALRTAGVLDDNLYTEKVSGASKRRPMLDAALMDCREGDTLCVWKLDRFGRSLGDLINRLDAMKKRGVGFRSLTDDIDTTTPTGMFILHLLGAVAQFERALAGQRTTAGMKVYRDNGGRVGRVPVMDRKMIAEARRMRREGISAQQIAKHLGVSRQTVYVRAFPRKTKTD